MGRKRARRTTMAALAWIEPREVIVPGYSGSMNPDVHPGDIILVQRVYHHAYSPETVRYVNSDLVAGITHAWEKAGLPVRMGAAVCVDQMLDSNATKQAIRYRLVEHGEKQVNCVDMESYYVLEVLEEFGIPTGIVRVITDYADETIGLDFSRIPRGKWRQRRYFFTHPKQWMVFRELVRTCNMARVHLTQYLDCYLSARIKINEVQTPAPPTFSDI
ncbi:hypothetical protein JXA80_00605 [bacterium]|nr:hypothetical protein [candidate division CSSED10-310 bacterium]